MPCSEHTFLSSMVPISSMIVMASAMICSQAGDFGQVTANSVKNHRFLHCSTHLHLRTWVESHKVCCSLLLVVLQSSADALERLQHPGI